MLLNEHGLLRGHEIVYYTRMKQLAVLLIGLALGVGTYREVLPVFTAEPVLYSIDFIRNSTSYHNLSLRFR